MTEMIDRLPPWSLWVIVALAGLLFLLLVWLVFGGRRGRAVERALASISYDTLADIVVPKADEGEIQIEYALLTGRGILVVETKDVEGVVFASDRMDDWTVIAGDRRYTFANPQPTLYDRVAAVAEIVQGVPVEGCILFPPGADFSKGLPKHVSNVAGLLAEYPRLDRGRDRSQVTAFMPHWDRLRQEAVSARMGRLPG